MLVLTKAGSSAAEVAVLAVGRGTAERLAALLQIYQNRMTIKHSKNTNTEGFTWRETGFLMYPQLALQDLRQPRRLTAVPHRAVTLR